MGKALVVRVRSVEEKRRWTRERMRGNAGKGRGRERETMRERMVVLGREGRGGQGRAGEPAMAGR